MTVARLRDLLADVPGEVDVVVNADSVTGASVFAALKDVSYEYGCDDEPVLRLMADDVESDPR